MALKIKSNKVRVILFFIVVAIALLSFTYAITQLLGDKGPSWKTIDLNPIYNTENDKIYPYYGEVKLDYFATGTKDDRNKELSEVKAEFNYAISSYFMLFDADYAYKKDGTMINNLNYINNHPNQKLVLHPFLYESLKDAYNMTIELDGKYNVFAGNLYDYWVRFLDFQDYENDPLFNNENKTKLEAIVDAIDDYKDGKFDLVFDDEEKSVIFELDENYEHKELITVNLQFMGQAYIIDGIKEYLVAKGFTSGKLYSDYYGFFATLGANPGTSTGGFWSESIYYPLVIETNAESLVDIKTPNSYNGVRISDYHVKYNYGLRTNSSLETIDIIRHPFYNAKTGYPENRYRLISLFSKDSTVAEIAKNTFNLFTSDYSVTKSYIKTNASEDEHYIMMVNETSNPVNVDDLVVYASKFLKDNGYFIIHENEDYTLEYIE
jgi:hypothetical protein